MIFMVPAAWSLGLEHSQERTTAMACTIEIVDGREVLHIHRKPQSVARRAVEARVRRALKAEGQLLRKPRGERERQELGCYFTADARTGNPDRRHCDLEQLARDYRVLWRHQVIAN